MLTGNSGLVARCIGLVITLFVGFAPIVAQAGSVTNIKPPIAWSKVRQGQVSLIDVRTPGEWRQSGVPKNARLVTIHDPRGVAGFVNGVRKVVRGDLRKPVALICRSGNRSAKAAEVLVQAGFKNVFNVTSGVLGEKGWLQRGLPMVSCGNCQAEN